MPVVDPTFMAANNAYMALKELDANDLAVAVAMLSQRLGVQVGANGGQTPSMAGRQNSIDGKHSSGSELSVKEFVKSKPTIKEIERVTVYAYCLVHHQNKSEFKAKDIDAFRTEVRGTAFSDLPVHIDNATKAGYLTAVGGGQKGITPRGEALVDALPDRAAVDAALEAHPLRGRRSKKTAKKARS